ncbi:uncharacterized protein LOC119742202 [Patiria miniata]|uniref:Saposin B-type domain-containing protein n=1 Tax=Patiria miniata TaxID=46514 RepID=A0A914B6U1_PATMI|nr:uncharacterized protein LOC119740220 [Patiria miniata]XP_038071535.1 uncharacterized protein LOC119740342 [Patiria miniata]XP_038074175.1 uncharacterized protein LOC119742202 [Patiria miniata]
MDNSVGFLVIVFIVAVSGQAIGIQQQTQILPTEQQDNHFLCVLCEEVLTFSYNVSTDKEFLALLQNYQRQVACTYLIPEGFKSFCENYIQDIPKLVVAFANTYLNPDRCAFLCKSSDMNQQLNVLGSIVKKMGGASGKDLFK